MSEEVLLRKHLGRGSIERVFVLLMASLVLSACGASVQRSYAYASPGYPRYVVVTPAPLPAAAAPAFAAPRVVVAAPALAAPGGVVAAPAPAAPASGAGYTPVASPLLAAFDSRPRGVAPSQPDYDAYVSARAAESRPYYGYRTSYGYRPYYGYAPYRYGPSYGYGPYYGYYGPRFGVGIPLWGARAWSHHGHTGGHHWHGPRGSYGGFRGHGASGGVHHAGPSHGGAHHGGARRR